MGLHDSGCGVSACAFQDVRDLVGEDIREQVRLMCRADHSLNTIIEDADIVAGRRLAERERPRQQVVGGLDGEMDLDRGAALTSAAVDPFDMDCRAGKELRCFRLRYVRRASAGLRDTF